MPKLTNLTEDEKAYLSMPICDCSCCQLKKEELKKKIDNKRITQLARVRNAQRVM